MQFKEYLRIRRYKKIIKRRSSVGMAAMLIRAKYKQNTDPEASV